MPERTAHEVISIFTGLGLPVCDDAAAIDQKVISQRDRYLRDKVRNPSADVRLAADLWFKNVADLQQRRPELLRTVYQLFAGLADAALAAALAGGLRELTPQLEKSLLQIAYRECRADDELADRFLRDFARDKGLLPGEPLVRPAPVPGFRAESRPGAVALSWTLPAQNCDEVEVLREDGAASAPRLVYRGRDTAFADRDVTPGTWYRYRAHSRFADLAGADAVARAVCVGEPRHVAAAWKDGAVRLSWRLPGPEAAVMVFKRAGAPPAVRLGPHGPLPAEASTTHVHCGPAEGHADGDVQEGIAYHYRVVADFGGGVFSDGVDVRATVPKAPPPVARLEAAHEHGRGRDVVALHWEPIPGGTPVEYVVVRREGAAPPGRVDEGTVIQKTDQTRCLDEAVEPGRRYSYAVFSRAAGSFSRAGAAAAPVDVLGEVSELQAVTADGTVELRWRTPTQARDVVVRRSLNPPRDSGDGALVPLAGPGHARDEGLRNGQRYHYLVCCGYRPDGVHEVFSRGVRLAAVPEQLPEPVTGFRAQAHGEEVLCTWTAPACGQVVVLRAPQPPEMVAGYRCAAALLDGLGERLTGVEAGRLLDPRPDTARPYYSAFTVAGAHAVAGGTAACVVCPDVRDLKPSATRDGVQLRWGWPDGCAAVRVVRREGDWPEGPDDPQAVAVACTRTDYSAAGEKFIDPVHRERTRLHYVVYAQPAGVEGVFFAPGAAPGCRACVQWEPWMTLRYRLGRPDASSLRGTHLRLNWTLENAFPGFSGLVLVANQERVPVDVADGVVLYRWKPKAHRRAAGYRSDVSLAPVRQRGWARFFCKAMVADPAQRYTALVVHPDVSVPLAPSGEPQVQPRDAAVRRYRRGVPRTILCPSCFEEFPLQQMLYGSFAGGEPAPGQYSWLDRLLGRPPRPPRDRRGQVLARKLCPNKHSLPFTAGTQASLVIGLIGAKYSGKSHFIAALVQRLEGQVGNDLQAALLPVTDETPERYRQEFHDPLFKNRLELALTVGTPPPLIYDLRFDGRLWEERDDRAVTLALYDTAGENFSNLEAVQQMVRYLAVASGIVVLLDPLQLPAVREALPASTRLPEPEDPNAIIGRVLRELEGGRVLVENAKLSTPVAVVLTKCDVLRDAGLIEANRLWCTDARHIGCFNRELHDDLSGMMAEYVQRWSPAVYQTVARRFTRFAFFGVSATGCASDTATRRYKYVSPWRVEDPLLWLLAEMGVIPEHRPDRNGGR